MRFPKEDAAAIRRGKLAQVRWPVGTPPRRERIYTLEDGKGDAWFQVRVIARDGDAFKVAVIRCSEPPRILRAVGGYDQEVSDRSIHTVDQEAEFRPNPPEPEAVDKATNDRYAQEAHEELDDLIRAMEEVRTALDAKCSDNPRLERLVGREVMKIRNHISAARRRLKQLAAGRRAA